MRRTGLAALAVVAGAALAACGSSGYGSDTTTSTEAASGKVAGDGSTSSTAARPDAGAATATVSVRTTGIGDVLTDAAGKTLYLYTPDEGTTSKVPAGVLAAWPPLVAGGSPTAGVGVDAAKLSVAEQPDGARWVAYEGHLLYTFSGDQAPGDTNGQGLGGVWYAVSPQGSAISS
jgi:predicted lipoprotein with Yx(FWY)xxD motif